MPLSASSRRRSRSSSEARALTPRSRTNTIFVSMRRAGFLHRMALALFLFSWANSFGAQWTVFQGAAWVKMAFQYGREFGLTQGLVRALDGDHPCRMCHEIRRQRDSHQDEAPILLAQAKGEVFFAATCALLEPRRDPWRATYGLDRPWTPLERPVRPAVPPPEAA